MTDVRGVTLELSPWLPLAWSSQSGLQPKSHVLFFIMFSNHLRRVQLRPNIVGALGTEAGKKMAELLELIGSDPLLLLLIQRRETVDESGKLEIKVGGRKRKPYASSKACPCGGDLQDPPL